MPNEPGEVSPGYECSLTHAVDLSVLLTLESSPANEGAAELEDRFVDVGAPFPSQAQAVALAST
jgi:hypothetical protein